MALKFKRHNYPLYPHPNPRLLLATLLQSGALTPLIDIFYEESLNGPVLSPDGTRLAYGVDRASPYEVTLVEIPTGNTTAFDVPVRGSIGWSPGGHWLSITAALGYSCEIHLVRPDGGETHKVFSGDWGGACGHTWSPDGGYMLVSAYAQDPTVPRLYVVSIPGGETRLVELPDVGVEFEWPRPYWVP
jgi:Tol biopolymer transport system component